MTVVWAVAPEIAFKIVKHEPFTFKTQENEPRGLIATIAMGLKPCVFETCFCPLFLRWVLPVADRCNPYSVFGLYNNM